eukprot:scaffold22.g6156.t1
MQAAALKPGVHVFSSSRSSFSGVTQQLARLQISSRPAQPARLSVQASRVCDLTGKRANNAYVVTFSHKRNKKLQQANLQYKKIYWPEGQRWVKLRVCTKALKTVERKGLDAMAKEAGIDLWKLPYEDARPQRLEWLAARELVTPPKAKNPREMKNTEKLAASRKTPLVARYVSGKVALVRGPAPEPRTRRPAASMAYSPRAADGHGGGGRTGGRYGSTFFDTQRTIYVGNLRFETREDTIKKFFEGYGPVTAVKLIYDKETGRSRGYGFVSFEDEQDASDALHDANNRELDGGRIRVNSARGPPGGTTDRGGFGGRGRGRGGFGGPARYNSGGRGDFRGGRYGDRCASPGRYSPRGRSRTRSRSRTPVKRYNAPPSEGGGDRKRARRYSSSRSPSRPPSRDRGARHSSPPPRSPSRDHGRGGCSRSPLHDAAEACGRGGGAAPAPAPAPAPTSQPAPAPATQPVSEATPPAASPAAPPAGGAAAATPASGGVVGGGAKPPPTTEAVRKELLRLPSWRRTSQPATGLWKELRRAKEDAHAAHEDAAAAHEDAAAAHEDVAAAQATLAERDAELHGHRRWLAALSDAAARAAGGRAAAAAAQAEADRRAGELAGLAQEVAAFLDDAREPGRGNGGALADGDGAAAANGATRGGGEDEDAAWEALAHSIQQGERAGDGGREDSGLQAAMQEAAAGEAGSWHQVA